MKKNLMIIILAIVVMVIIVGAIILTQQKSNLKLQTADEIQAMLASIYNSANVQLPGLETMDIPITDEMQLQSFTGLKSNKNIETLVVSTPFINAQAYSLAVLKVSDKANVEQIKQDIYDNIDMRKWICVSAEKLYITNYHNVIFVVMSSKEWAKPIYEEFKKYVENDIGKELEKTEAGEDLSIPEAETIQ